MEGGQPLETLIFQIEGDYLHLRKILIVKSKDLDAIHLGEDQITLLAAAE